MDEGENVAAGRARDFEMPSNLISQAHSPKGKSGGSNEEGDYCRICRSEATDETPLFYPCKCSGSIKFVHQNCLMEWLSHSQKKYCELCKTHFRFTKLYDHRMPQTLPLPVFIRHICLHVVRNTLKWLRYLFVGLVWLGWLPWSIRQVWRGLFWLADGSWGSATSMNASASLPHLHGSRNTTTGEDSAVEVSLSVTQNIVSALPQIATPLSTILDYSSSDFLPVKIVQALYPNLFHWSVGLITAASSNSTDFASHPDRQPSFLSDVRYLKTLTTHQTINNSVTDVLEGQLICLLVVTAFVLIFLIREWVINQQPPPDLPEANRAEEARPVVAHGALRGAARRRRRWPGEDGREEIARQIAGPRPRPRFPVPDVEAEDGGIGTSEVPGIRGPPAYVSEGSEAASTADNDLAEQSQAQDASSPRNQSFVTRPALPTLQIAPSIRRDIEEGVEIPELPGIEAFQDLWNRTGGDPAEALRIITEEGRQVELGWVVPGMVRVRQRHSELSEAGLHARPGKAEDAPDPEFQPENGEQDEDITDPTQTLDLPSWLEPSDDELDLSEAEESILAVQSAGHDSSESLLERDPTETLIEPFSDPVTAPTPAASDNASPREVTVQEAEHMDTVDDENVSGTDLVVGTPDTTVDGERNKPNHPHTAVETLADWLWQTDEYLAQADVRLREDDERLVQDVNHEPPFVAVPAAQVISDNEEEVETEIEAEEEQNQEAHAAAGAAGVNVNNPEAIEDAEDLDGIMELIGMQGPLTGMVQNVIFTEFLITFTLAASVWLPYIWGKIALLLLANPLGVFVRAPFHLLSRVADTSVDILLFVLGMCVYLLHFCLNLLLYLASFVHPTFRPWINTHSVARISLTLASGSGTRLEKAIFRTVWGLKPDLPTFSVLSHQALRLFERQAINNLKTTGQMLVYVCYEVPVYLRRGFRGGRGISKSTISEAIHLLATLYRQTVNTMVTSYQRLRSLGSLSLGVDAPLDTSSLDYSLVRWNTQDRIVAIVIGYAFFAFAGYLYIKSSRLILGLKKGEQMEGIVADGLNQAGGVMKVIVIIGIEMIVFPLYCGLLLDVALMPLFEGVGFQSRLDFVMNAPMTALFVHWFVGTCYMFHFALFVAMCRKIMRRGVLYFIRDPDDPTFHPVRDVLERPIATQLSKIAFSGLVYGGLVILCLGGIVWVVSRVEGIFPIHWTSDEPILEFPIDLLFYNFLLPILIRNIEPSKKLNAMYEWWFRRCARWLRLSNFLFNAQEDDEQGRHIRRTWSAVFRREVGKIDEPVIGKEQRTPAEDRRGLETYFVRDGTFVRTPGSDSVRILKGGRVFLEVDENNNRIDGQPDEDDGPHGRKNDNFVKVYIPPMFRARIAAFVIYIWAFAAVTGIVFAIVPLSIGRRCIHLITQSGRPPNDLYAFSVGLYLCGGVVYLFSYCRVCKDWVSGKVEYYFRDTTLALPRLRSSVVYISGLAYMGFTFGFILPFLFSSLVELYFVIPLHTYLTSTYSANLSAVTPAVLPPTIHVVQTWTLGLIYLRVILRLATTYPDPQTRAATAIRSILRRGFWRPDVRLATRSFVLPSVVLISILLAAPLCLGWTINASLRDPRLQAKVYRYAYPGILGVAWAVYSAVFLRRQVWVWRTRIRDDVYMIGERLHNFGEAQRRRKKGKAKAWVRDGAVPDRLQIR